MKKLICVIAAVSVALLGGCSDKPELIDLSSLESTIDEEVSTPLETIITSYQQDSYKKQMIGTSASCTFSGENMLIYSSLGQDADDSIGSQTKQLYKLDLKTGECVPMCTVPGCTHDYDAGTACINNAKISRPTAVGDDVWYLSHNTIMKQNGGTSEVIFENKFCTEYEESIYRDYEGQKYVLSSFIVDDDSVYLFGPTYTVRLDRQTMKPEEYITLSEAMIFSQFVCDGKAYVCNELQELIMVDYNTKEVKKLSDQINNACTYGGMLYYTRYNGGMPSLYCASIDGSGEKKLCDDCYMDFVIKDGKVFYHNYATGGNVRCYDLSTGQDAVIYDGMTACDCIVTAEHIDRIFAIGEIRKSGGQGICNIIISVKTDGSGLWTKEIDGTDTIL